MLCRVTVPVRTHRIHPAWWVAAVTFLATLELVRRRQVRAEQHDIFGPIVIESMPDPGP